MDSAIVGSARSLQLVVLAILLVIAIYFGAKIAFQGQRGFATVLPEIASLLLAAWVIARPNDFLTLLLGFVGGVQTPVAPSGPRPAPAAAPVTAIAAAEQMIEFV